MPRVDAGPQPFGLGHQIGPIANHKFRVIAIAFHIVSLWVQAESVVISLKSLAVTFELEQDVATIVMKSGIFRLLRQCHGKRVERFFEAF